MGGDAISEGSVLEMQSAMDVEALITNIDDLTLGEATGNLKAEENGESQSERGERERRDTENI